MNRSPIAVARNTTNGCAINGVPLLNATKDSFVGKHSSCPIMINHNDDKNKLKNPEMAAKIIKESNIVCFDVDSTVIQEEGIDELADFCGKGSEVSRVTKEAMGGSMTFQDALRIRLNIIRPSQSQVEEFIKVRPSKLTEGVKQFIGYLKAEGKQVFLISGGFDSLIEPVANELNIPMSNVFANKLCFTESGDYADFDTTKPTSRSGGKSEAVAIVKRNNEASSVITMIGDGATDLEAVPPADYFIGFGGNVVRTEVFNRAKYFVTDFDLLWAKDE
ncbi:phosphoserine phosphatase [Episyrphus balteatus]|uniref:phosphoserine phosphatase n=1 Tax=Episyrphus balteatus TaxID=286459 RepID=UPI002486B9BE|nr:phosphoserine phosphatase [Episyrphus balteatus]